MRDKTQTEAAPAPAKAGASTPLPAAAVDTKVDAKVDAKAPWPSGPTFRLRHASGLFVHPKNGKGVKDAGLVLHSGGEQSPDTLFEWVYIAMSPVTAPAPASAAGPAKPTAAAAAVAAKPAGKGAPAGGPALDSVLPQLTRYRLLRHVASGLYVHPKGGVAQRDATLVLYPTADLAQGPHIAWRTARLDLEAGSTANADDDSDDDCEGRDGGPVQWTTPARSLAVHPKGGDAKPADDTPLVLHLPAAGPVVTFRLVFGK